MYRREYLLDNETAKTLFNENAKEINIFDFHCHLDAKEIYENKNFETITEAWLKHDHYKWRLMRGNGFSENLITGDADDYEKFYAFTKSLENSPGNPLYHWSHLELNRYFGIESHLTVENAKEVYDNVNKQLKGDDYKVRNFIKKSKVTKLITTDDPIDDLKYHKLLKEDENFEVEVMPGFRPDNAINIEDDNFADYIQKLSLVSKIQINSYDDLLESIKYTINYFDDNGCVTADHGLNFVPFSPYTKDEVNEIFKTALKNNCLTAVEISQYKTCTLVELAKVYVEKNWVMQYHMNIFRNNNTKMLNKLGKDSGYDSIADYTLGSNLSNLLNTIEQNSGLPKTILYSGNPSHNYTIASLMGAFQSESNVSKVQFGSAWWFNDNVDGIKEQLKALANLGVLGKFVGMLTDSRSFLSYPRHEFFRRILCNYIGDLIEGEQYNPDLNKAGKIIENISYNNAIQFFDKDVK